MTDDEKTKVLQEWLDGDFRNACVNDVMRLRESMMLIRVGMDSGKTPEKIMGIAIASFVAGLIHKTRPLTVPVENN